MLVLRTDIPLHALDSTDFDTENLIRMYAGRYIHALLTDRTHIPNVDVKRLQTLYEYILSNKRKYNLRISGNKGIHTVLSLILDNIIIRGNEVCIDEGDGTGIPKLLYGLITYGNLTMKGSNILYKAIRFAVKRVAQRKRYGC